MNGAPKDNRKAWKHGCKLGEQSYMRQALQRFLSAAKLAALEIDATV